MRASLAVLVSLPLLMGCASTLRTYTSSEQSMKGIPVHAPVLVEIERTTRYQLVSDNAELARFCTPETVVTLEFLPIGERYYVSFDPATFGKGEFSMEFTDGGALKKISLGSDPGTSAATEAATGMLATVLPFIAMPKEAPESVTILEEDPTTRQLKERHCARVGTSITGLRTRRVD
jgi:hypothetical protein